ncbi:hypothetical protein WOC76_08890 [Methylocystis sp. IM3]|jgi:predicted ArsR family transcriptional regulator|uniref:hypothetical protein n=1 Tax=unclassified Methylocystis TaxID=2625913 RepID=UPI000FA2FA24|nr:MAG: hypothetical protein EKK29_02885 [Hyphomicrobiales bacterium]
MLDVILRLAAKRSVISQGDVARDLSISPGLAKTLFFELERQGYLKSVSAPCDTPCGDCAAKEACRFFKAPPLWAFTEKGIAAARRLSK